LNNIVIWLSPRAETNPGNTQSVAVNLNDPSSIVAAGKDDVWQITNTSASTQSLYVRSESGKVAGVGVVNAGATATFLPREPGLNLLLSDSSESPLARIYVVSANVLRQQVRVVSEGKITFPNLPPGTYTVSAWHERLPGASISVTLPPEKITTAPLIFGVNSLPKAL
jgi:hypothetical protein